MAGRTSSLVAGRAFCNQTTKPPHLEVVLIAAAGGNSHLENELGSSWSARSGRIDSTDSPQGRRAAVKGFAGFTNTKEVTPPLVTHLPLGARPSLGHRGLPCPCSHCSAGQTATAEHLPVAVPPSHQDPVLLPQSQQGRYSPASSPITLSSPPHPTPPTPLTRARPVRTGCSISHGLHAFVLKYRYLSQFSVPLLIRCDTL